LIGESKAFWCVGDKTESFVFFEHQKVFKFPQNSQKIHQIHRDSANSLYPSQEDFKAQGANSPSLSITYRFLKLQSSRSSEAEQYFKRAIRLAPLDPSTHHHYGNLSFFPSLSCSPQTL
jgi:hypothetical protein